MPLDQSAGPAERALPTGAQQLTEPSPAHPTTLQVLFDCASLSLPDPGRTRRSRVVPRLKLEAIPAISSKCVGRR
jgi:hypothetical protein